MRNAALITVVSSFALALAACGGGAQEEEQSPVTDVETAPEVDATGATGEIAATDAADAGEAEPEATPSPTPSPSASAAPSPTPSPAAAMAVVTAPPAFALCRACHSTVAGENGIGPTLAGVYGAKSAHISGFDYSDAMEGAGLTWNEATLSGYLESPSAVVPGTTMSFAGVRNEAQRKAIVDYLKTL